jgi:hypothetical protein
MSTYDKYIEHVASRGGDEGAALEFESDCLNGIPRDKLPAFARAVLDHKDPTPEYWRWLIAQYK